MRRGKRRGTSEGREQQHEPEEAASVPSGGRVRLIALLLWAGIVAGAAALLLSARFPPLYDYYHWLYEGKIVADLWFGSATAAATAARNYTLLARPIPNLASPL